MSSVVITGVTSGIGYETAKLFIERGYSGFGSVRCANDGAALAREFGPQFVALVFDVRDAAAVAAAARQVELALRGERLAGLINNAGTCLPGPLLDQPLDEIRLQLETNLTGPFIVTKAFLPLLGATRMTAPSRRLGRVINVSSICGTIAAPFGSAYCASKSGLEGFSESLRRELMGIGIAVVVVAPGLTRTPIWAKSSVGVSGHFETTSFSGPFRKVVSILSKTAQKHGMEPRQVAEAIWTATTVKNPKVRYAPTRHPILENVLMYALPRQAMDLVMRRRFHLSRQPARTIASAPSWGVEERAFKPVSSNPAG